MIFIIELLVVMDLPLHVSVYPETSPSFRARQLCINFSAARMLLFECFYDCSVCVCVCTCADMRFNYI